MAIRINEKTGVISIDGECTAFKVSDDTISMSIELVPAWFSIAVIPVDVDRKAFIKKVVTIALEEHAMQTMDPSVYRTFGDITLDYPGAIDSNAMLFGSIANRIVA